MINWRWCQECCVYVRRVILLFPFIGVFDEMYRFIKNSLYVRHAESQDFEQVPPTCPHSSGVSREKCKRECII